MSARVAGVVVVVLAFALAAACRSDAPESAGGATQPEAPRAAAPSAVEAPAPATPLYTCQITVSREVPEQHGAAAEWAAAEATARARAVPRACAAAGGGAACGAEAEGWQSATSCVPEERNGQPGSLCVATVGRGALRVERGVGEGEAEGGLDAACATARAAACGAAGLQDAGLVACQEGREGWRVTDTVRGKH